MKLVIMRLKQKIQADPHDRQAREDLARTYDEVGRKAEAAEQRRKARQCERFNPDYDYAAKLKPLGLEARLYAGGEIVTVCDDLWTFWAEPGELQRFLEQTPPAELNVRDLPLSEHQPTEHHLQQLWETVPGGVYRVPADAQWDGVWEWKHVEFKELPEGGWITRDQKKDYHFWQEDVCGLQKSDLVPI